MSTAGPSPTEQIAAGGGSAGVGLGYGIAIAVSTFVLISAVVLATYACLRLRAQHNHHRQNRQAATQQPDQHTGRIAGGLRGLPGPVLAKVCWADTRPVYPKLVLGESKRLPRPNSGPCSICLSDYKAKETIRCMPDCNHCFHVTCIDQWLKMSPTCPICRSSPAPSAANTPLSDLVPLAFYPR